MQLVVDKIAKAFGIHEIFKDVSFMVEQGEHVGLVMFVNQDVAFRRGALVVNRPVVLAVEQALPFQHLHVPT